MTVPNLPTDNLYKFLALSGVTIALVSLYAPWKRHDTIRARLDELVVEVALLDVDTESLAPAESDDSAQAAGVSQAIPDSVRLDRRRRLAVARAKLDTLDRLTNELLVLWIVSVVSLTIGVVMAERGFRLWYRRVQLPMDRALKRGGDGAA